jgi:hypothetical protein
VAELKLWEVRARAHGRFIFQLTEEAFADSLCERRIDVADRSPRRLVELDRADDRIAEEERALALGGDDDTEVPGSVTGRHGHCDAGGDSKYELGWHVSPTANQRDAIAAVELVLAEAERLAGRPLRELAPPNLDGADGAVLPLVTIVTDNGGPFRSFRCEAFIATHPELRHVRTRVKSPGQNGSRERGFGSLKYERLFLEEIADVLDLTLTPSATGSTTTPSARTRPCPWNRPHDVHLGLADPLVPTSCSRARRCSGGWRWSGCRPGYRPGVTRSGWSRSVSAPSRPR